MHSREAEKQQRYRWWIEAFLPKKVRPGSRDERYRLGILIITLLAFFVATSILSLQVLALPISVLGQVSSILVPLVPLLVLGYVRLTGRYRQAALLFGLVATPLVIAHLLTVKTIYLGHFHWIPWIIFFVSFLSGRRQGLIMAAVTLGILLLVLLVNSGYGHGYGIFLDFDRLFQQILAHQILAALAILAMMFTFALYNDRMEAELESQHVLRAQTAHKSMIGEMLGNLAHEVNNPLAIVHTALVHYRRLLETHRLEPYMQKGLIERMGDALDRLRNVVEHLNSAADWSELEEPRSFASLQSDQDRPPQFGNSRLMSRRGETQAQEKKRAAWPYLLLRLAISTLDRTLPPVTKSWSASQRFRARATALICTVGLVSITANFLQQALVVNSLDSLRLSAWVTLLFGLVGMVVLKLVPRPQVIGVGYLMLLYAVIASFASFSSRSILMPSLYWFPIMMASLFLVTRPRIALLMSLFLLASHILLMVELQGYGLQIPLDRPYSLHVQRLQSTLILVCFTSLVLAAAFTFLMDSTHSQLVTEKDWHLLSARLREVNELAESAAILIGEPLRQLGEYRLELQKNGHNLDTLQRMQESVDRITGVSQSFALLSRPQTHEDIQIAPGRVWLNHIHNICFRRAAAAGWNLSTAMQPIDGSIEGPLGRLTMLVITCLKEAFGHQAPQPLSPLRLDVLVDDALVYLRIRFTACPVSKRTLEPQEELDEAMRLSLLQELLESLQATLKRKQEQDEIILELQWHHADLRQGPGL